MGVPTFVEDGLENRLGVLNVEVEGGAAYDMTRRDVTLLKMKDAQTRCAVLSHECVICEYVAFKCADHAAHENNCVRKVYCLQLPSIARR